MSHYQFMQVGRTCIALHAIETVTLQDDDTFLVRLIGGEEIHLSMDASDAIRPWFSPENKTPVFAIGPNWSNP